MFIIFHGKIDHKKAIELLLQSDCSIFVRERSRKNMAGFPTKFVEAITAGTGVIANNVSDITKYSFDNVKIIEDVDLALLENAIDEKIKQGKVKHVVSNAFDYRLFKNSMSRFVDELLRSIRV